jgi:hypothetical protein
MQGYKAELSLWTNTIVKNMCMSMVMHRSVDGYLSKRITHGGEDKWVF